MGLGLGISPDTLDAVERNNRDCEDCYRAMLKQWLKEEPALSSLADALRSPSVNMGHLAEELMSMGLCKLHIHSCYNIIVIYTAFLIIESERTENLISQCVIFNLHVIVKFMSVIE